MNNTVSDQRRGFRLLILSVFVVSGFAGLIYESIWSHYLKLFLGHAAYAQTLVLALYMGGMAAGAWLAGQWSARLKQPLLAYAAVELILGFVALLFHRIFVATTNWAFDTVIPAMDSPLGIDVFKWTLGALLILPQCLLLGATFPLVSVGIIRTLPHESGYSLSGLYFTNSLGASAGVLVSGFVLIALVGLPGTIMTAGLLNVAIALVVWMALKRTGEIAGRPVLAQSSELLATRSGFSNLMLLVAFITGATSFMYEVGWIRMLSLVLGSATHSFELMLSAFILGIALGSLLIRGRLDRLTNPLVVLAFVQIAMGLLALLTLPIYNQSFDWMAAALKALAKTDEGYVLFNVISHLICVTMMVPVTICAGMTLPLITYLLIQRGSGESAIGRVYAANTLGAISGVLIAVHFFMPELGLKSLIVVGGIFDAALGVALLLLAGVLMQPRIATVAVTGMALCVLIGLVVPLDPSKLSSGVFRMGNASTPNKILYYRDGKTSSVSVQLEEKRDLLAIANNGKVDAGITRSGEASPDDSTMILAAAIPLQYRPEAKSVAVIGMGSGRSTHAFLGYPGLERVDTIEIEEAVVEGARLFGDLVARAYDDPRSHIHIEDAKTFFSRHKQQYDIIMSEPSNPWVSGIASLFSQEFYARIKHKLKPGGIFVQWFQLYEIDPLLVASVMKALAEEFGDYAIFAADGADLLILATNERLEPIPLTTDLGPAVSALLKHIGIENGADLALRQVGNAEVMHPFFASFGVPANSDYFPVLDLNASRTRYRQQTAGFIVNELHAQLWGAARQVNRLEELSGRSSNFYTPVGWAQEARQIGQYFQWRQGSGPRPSLTGLSDAASVRIVKLQMIPQICDPALLRAAVLPALVGYLETHLPYTSAEFAQPMVKHILSGNCTETIAERRAWAGLISTVANGEHRSAIDAAKEILARYVPEGATKAREIVLNIAAREALAGDQPEVVLELAKQYPFPAKSGLELSGALRALAASRVRAVNLQ